MAKPTIYRWSPTTCDCEIYQYMDENGDFSYVTADEAEQLLQQIYTQYPDTTKKPEEWAKQKKQTKRCPEHQGLSDGAQLGQVMRDEDSRKSRVLRGLLGYEGFNLNLQQTKTNEDGSTYIDFKNGVSVSWEWVGTGADRVLQVSISGSNLTINQKSTLQNFCDTKFGVGKVNIL